ncbi:hypothetical protein [Herbiconiux liangxiaofengii]|uniref:hypothetical protein n=1 Tax=Herbiconiux liangxiaofengii TaxID=3342795 RepID=UPI0035BAF6BB
MTDQTSDGDTLPDVDVEKGDLNDNDLTRKDMTYSPSSGRETDELQHDAAGSQALDDPDIDQSRITSLPGTGGPDDVGEIDIEGAEINIPHRTA